MRGWRVQHCDGASSFRFGRLVPPNRRNEFECDWNRCPYFGTAFFHGRISNMDWLVIAAAVVSGDGVGLLSPALTSSAE